MMLDEANKRLKKVQITEEQLWQINSLYCILNLDKDDFCKIVDLIGLDKLIQQQSRYERFDKAEQELRAKERYLQAKKRLQELEDEKEELENIVNSYKPIGWSDYLIYWGAATPRLNAAVDGHKPVRMQSEEIMIGGWR